MDTVPRPISERERLETIKRLDMLSRDIPSSVQRLLKQASSEFNVENCMLTIVGKYFQHTKSFTDVNIGVLSREYAFCSHTILQNDPLIVEDADADVRFRDNPYVVSSPHMKFYAGAPLSTTKGHNLGTICLIDRRPRVFPTAARQRLLEYAGIISRRLGFYDDSRDLSHFAAEDLARLMRAEADCSDNERLEALIEAYYSRLTTPR